jgi:hypothetical protein
LRKASPARVSETKTGKEIIISVEIELVEGWDQQILRRVTMKVFEQVKNMIGAETQEAKIESMILDAVEAEASVYAQEHRPPTAEWERLTTSQKAQVSQATLQIFGRIKEGERAKVKRILIAAVLDVDRKNDTAAAVALAACLEDPKLGETDAIIRGINRIFAMDKNELALASI